MALTYTQATQISANQTYRQQMQAAVLEQALAVAGSSTPSAASLALAAAIVRTATPTSISPYTDRFLFDALVVNKSTLTGDNTGSGLSPAPADATFAAAVTASWNAQAVVGP